MLLITYPYAAHQYTPPSRAVFGEEEHENPDTIGSPDLAEAHRLVMLAEGLHGAADIVVPAAHCEIVYEIPINR